MIASGTRRSQGTGQRLDSNNTDSIVSTESELSSFNIPLPPRLAESTRAGLPPLTRTEEKSLANELISQLPIDTPLSIGEQMVRRRACEIVQDNYSQKFLPGHIASDWFYDFLSAQSTRAYSLSRVVLLSEGNSARVRSAHRYQSLAAGPRDPIDDVLVVHLHIALVILAVTV